MNNDELVLDPAFLEQEMKRWNEDACDLLRLYDVEQHNAREYVIEIARALFGLTDASDPMTGREIELIAGLNIDPKTAKDIAQAEMVGEVMRVLGEHWDVSIADRPIAERICRVVLLNSKGT